MGRFSSTFDFLVLGTTFSYTSYFTKRRNKIFEQQKKNAKEFIEKLELAILVAVRMTGGNAIKTLHLNSRKPMDRNKLCNVCQAYIMDCHGQSIVHFKASKFCFIFAFCVLERVKRNDDFSSTSGFTLDWIHEKSTCAEELENCEVCIF